jgi:heme-degrading monooxygenase HmoA
MSILLVELEVRSGEGDGLASSFQSVFAPAIATQPGFQAVRLLRPVASSRWFLEIEFVDEPHRLAWVATELHGRVWPQLEAHCDRAVPEVFESAK